MGIWQLFVDESGDDARSEDTFVVAGVLVGSALDFSADLRDALEEAFWGVRYPPHASELCTPAGALIARLEGGRLAEPGGSDVLDWIEPARQVLLTSTSPLAVELRAALEAGGFASRKARYPAVQALQAWLREHAHRDPHVAVASGALKELLRGDDARLTTVLGRIADAVGPERCFIVGAAQRVEDVHAEEAGYHAAGYRDPYLALLEACLERVVMLLREGEEQHTVQITVAERDVGLPRRRLREGDVFGCIDGAMRHPFAPGGEGGRHSVQLLVSSIVPFDAAVHPGVVLADFAANRLRWTVRGRPPRWRTLTHVARQHFALPLAAVPRAFRERTPAPALGTGGHARRQIRAAFGGEAAQASDFPLDGWVADQVQHWSDLGAALTGTPA